MDNLPESMYDYRGGSENTVTIIDECFVCGQDVYSNEEYRYRNGVLMHDDCADEYEDEE